MTDMTVWEQFWRRNLCVIHLAAYMRLTTFFGARQAALQIMVYVSIPCCARGVEGEGVIGRWRKRERHDTAMHINRLEAPP